jgi:hypothetical protein
MYEKAIRIRRSTVFMKYFAIHRKILLTKQFWNTYMKIV